MPFEEPLNRQQEFINSLESMQQMGKSFGKAIGRGREDILGNLRDLAKEIIEHRDDVANLTEDNKERLERRLMYKVEGHFYGFEKELWPLFDSLWTEEPPQVNS